MDFSLYLPIAGTSVNLWLLLALGAGVGVLSGLFGVGGGFLLTPLLIMIGIPPTIAAASDANQIVAASASGVYAHWRLKNVDLRMATLLIVGGFAGGTAGVQLIKVLRAVGSADLAIHISYVFMLASVGGIMFVDGLLGLRKGTVVSAGLRARRELRITWAERPLAWVNKIGNLASWFVRLNRTLPWKTRFETAGTTMSLIVPLGLGILVGMLAAIMGVGGGFIMVPTMLYLLKMPMPVVVGTSLLQVMFTCINVTLLHAYTNHTVDFVLALMLLAGSTLGTQAGVRIGRRLGAEQFKLLLAAIVLLVMGKMLSDLLSAPAILLAERGGPA
ncbi:MAG: sulfite exporter TauE/SafE family protein [Gemmatimonadota bacterium]|nr:sulfite exporter TauE/SafE family protein [Gemmatimonadota bacterium]